MTYFWDFVIAAGVVLVADVAVIWFAFRVVKRELGSIGLARPVKQTGLSPSGVTPRADAA